MLYNLHFFSSKCRLFHNATFFGFCITHILNTECAKIWKKNRRQKVNTAGLHSAKHCVSILDLLQETVRKMHGKKYYKNTSCISLLTLAAT